MKSKRPDISPQTLKAMRYFMLKTSVSRILAEEQKRRDLLKKEEGEAGYKS